MLQLKSSKEKVFSMKNTIKQFGIIAFVALIMCSMLACGSSESKGGKTLKGTYVHAEGGSFTFSGNNFKAKEGENLMEGSYELVEEYKEKGFSRGVIILKFREGQKEHKYNLEGNKLMLGSIVFTKQ